MAETVGVRQAKVEGIISDLIARIWKNLENIDAAEAEAIIAKLVEAGTALATGRYWTAAAAAWEALRLYRKAVLDMPAPGPAPKPLS